MRYCLLLLLVVHIPIVVCTLLLLVRPGIDSSPPHSPPLTLSCIMGAIAVSALAFAFLALPLSVALTVAVFGILVLQGMRALVTGGGGARRWLPWLLWSLALLACPVAIAVVIDCITCSRPKPSVMRGRLGRHSSI